jgi:hypothetical protein
MAEPQAIWEEAKQHYVQTLTTKERDCMEKVNSLEQLLERVRGVQKKYDNRKLGSTLRRLSPFLAHLNSFSSVVNTFAQAHPLPTCFIWGSIAIVLEVMHNSSLTCSCVEKISRNGSQMLIRNGAVRREAQQDA